MNTVSGLILDTKLKEQRRGGIRITIVGTIFAPWAKDITHVWADERVKMGIVLSRERHPVFVESDVEENLRIAAYLLPGGTVKERIAYVYQIFPALHPIRKRKAGFLSGGEQQMLAIGMSLMPKPKLMLLDEAASRPRPRNTGEAHRIHRHDQKGKQA